MPQETHQETDNTQTTQLTKEEQEALTNDLNAVLEKHNAEISITSQLHIGRSQTKPQTDEQK